MATNKPYIKAKLTGRSNWSTWSVGMKWDLKKLKVGVTEKGETAVSGWQLVQGITKRSTRAKEIPDLEELNESAASEIYQACGEGPQSLVIHLDDATEMWNLLEKTYSVVAFSAVDEVISDLDGLSLENAVSAEAYVERFQDLKRSLENLQVKMPVEWYLYCLLRGLDTSGYGVWTSEVRRRNIREWDLDTLLAEVIAEARSVKIREKHTLARSVRG